MSFLMKFGLALLLWSASFLGLCQDAGISADHSRPLKPVFRLWSKKLPKYETTADISNFYYLVRYRNGKLAKTKVQVTYKTLPNGEIEMVPQAELAEGLQFKVAYVEAGDTLFLKYATPPKQADIYKQQAAVEHTYPSASTLPRNVLFFHVRFNTPMIETERAFEYVQLFGAENEIPNIWRHQSFWLDNGRVLVLMVHPGRVKRGIKMDIPFLVGNNYTLKLKSGLRAKNGTLVGETSLKSFSITTEDYGIPAVNKDAFILPKAATKKQLVLSFNEGMDYSSILDGVKVFRNGTPIKGVVYQQGDDKTYAFLPNEKWQKGNYTILFQKKVCDYSGNRLQRPFEITDPKEMEKDKNELKITFKL